MARVILWLTGVLSILYLGGQGDLVSRSKMGINGLTIWVIGVINLFPSLLNPPDKEWDMAA